MDLKQLKHKIETNTLDTISMIWKYSSKSALVVSQYLNAISKSKNLELKYIDDLSEIAPTSFIIDNNLYVLKTKKFNDKVEYNNLIILCEETTNKDAIIFSDLQDWQVVDYAKSFLPGISIDIISDLIKGYDSYQLFISDMEKLACFDSDAQSMMLDKVFDQLSITPTLTVFDLTSALLRNNRQTAKEVLKVRDRIDLTDMHFLTILLNNIKKIVAIQLGQSVTADELGITDKQFYVLKTYNCGIYSNEKLLKIYEMLLDIENKFKFNGLEVCDIIDYVVCKILGE